MSKVDWSKAPDGAEWFASGKFYRTNKFGRIEFCLPRDTEWAASIYKDKSIFFDANDFDSMPIQQQWPESDERIDIVGTNGGDGMHYDESREDEKVPTLKPRSAYSRDIIGLDGAKTTVDVYRVLDAFKTDSPAIDHAIKKLLCAGIRHQKDRKQDLQEAIDSIAAELLLMSQR